MTGFDIRLYRDLDLDLDNHCVYGRDGIYVSVACVLWRGRRSRANVVTGRQLLVVNITGKW
jgi:hypothetical protein